MLGYYPNTVGVGFPLSDPYSSPAFNTNYIHVNNGTIATTTSSVLTNATGNDKIVDWVFLELRIDNTTGTTVVATKSALLQSDGDIVATDGISPVTFNNTLTGNYYVAVRHRNHLGFRTANTLFFGNIPVNVNFSNNSISLFGTTPLIQINNNTYIMTGGDSNSDGSVDSIDSAIWEIQNGSFDDYTFNADYNVDGSVDSIDSALWELNNGKYEELD
jgi:hypothetical protein